MDEIEGDRSTRAPTKEFSKRKKGRPATLSPGVLAAADELVSKAANLTRKQHVELLEYMRIKLSKLGRPGVAEELGDLLTDPFLLPICKVVAEHPGASVGDVLRGIVADPRVVAQKLRRDVLRGRVAARMERCQNLVAMAKWQFWLG